VVFRRTIIWTSSLALSAESLAVKRNIGSAPLNAAVVAALFALPNVTVPGPLTRLQVLVNTLPAGRPSSVAVPFKVTVFVGSEIV
jgi:hypothetical protein